MSRTDALAAAAASGTTVTVPAVTLSGTNRLVYIFVEHWLDNGVGTTVDTIAIGGTTVYDLGVSVGNKVQTVVSAGDAAFKMEVFRVFDSALPANGDRDVVVTLSASVDSGVLVCAVAYDDADQTTGHRGTPVTFTSEDATISMAITADGTDQEGIAFVGVDTSALAVTPTAPTTELITETGAGGVWGDVLQRPAGGTPIEAGWAGTAIRELGWAASIMAAAGGGVGDDVLIRLGNMLATGGSGLVMAAFATGSAIVALGGGAYFMRRKRLDAMTSGEDF